MISVPAGTRIVVATEPVDGRKGMDSCQAASNIRPPSASKSRPPQPYQQLQR